jgi:hypothetical protein
MYNIEFKYLRNNGITQVSFHYVSLADTYEQAIEEVKAEANKRLEKMGGSIISII